VRVVVDHRQQSDEEEDEHVAGQLDDLHDSMSDDIPVVDHLDEQAGEDTKLRASRTCLHQTRNDWRSTVPTD